MSGSTGYRFIKPEALARVKNLRIMARAVVEGFITGLHKSPYKGFSVEFAEHREYVHGDNIRYLDWTVLARTDKYFVKQFEEETNLSAYIILDASASMGYGVGEISKLEYASYLAATLAYMMVRQQDSVGLVLFDDKIRVRIGARSTPTHLNMVLRQLEQTEPGNTTDLARTFHDLAGTFKKRGLIIIISDLFDDPGAVERALRHFRHKRHEVIVFHIFDKAELDFPFDRLTDFVDMETNERLQIDPRIVRKQYKEEIQAFIETYRKSCSEAGIDYQVTDTSAPFDYMLTRYLAKRSRLG